MTKEVVVSDLSKAEVTVKDVELRYKGVVYDVATILGDASAKEAKKELTSIRTAIEKTRKALKQPFLDEGKRIDDYAKLLTERVTALEKPLLECYKAAEQKAADEAKAAEAARAKALEDEVAELRAQLAKQTILNEAAEKQVVQQMQAEAAVTARTVTRDELVEKFGMSRSNAALFVDMVIDGNFTHLKFVATTGV